MTPNPSSRSDFPSSTDTNRSHSELKMPSAIEAILVSSQKHFSGRLEIVAPASKSWDLYFRLGRIVWVGGGTHPHRRWRRALSQACPQLDLSRLNVRKTDKQTTWEYLVLSVLLKRQQIDRESVQAVANYCTIEVLFDILQACQSQTLTGIAYAEETLTESLALLKVADVLTEARIQWETWGEDGLSSYSPDAAPTIRHREQLRSSVSDKAYRKLTVLANGRSTLRDLAVSLKQDLRRLTKSLLPYVRRGSIEFVKIPDLHDSQSNPTDDRLKGQNFEGKSSEDAPLIACIDDSLQNCKILEVIVRGAGYRFIYITDPLEALPTLIKRQPDLVFLDLMMPVINGYEVCAQIRRVSALEKVPVVILTSQDGLVDRMRAKMVKASGFLSKPVDPSKVLTTMEKLLKIES
ncbi:response regulator [Baaleninema sp.]|uniref:response regulator n=1 Tax=Baaleninema sp. TaxID=3101197 RepID=UPI003D03EE34